MQVQITQNWHHHREGTTEECTEGVADLLCNVLKIGSPVKPEKPTRAKEKATTVKAEA